MVGTTQPQRYRWQGKIVASYCATCAECDAEHHMSGAYHAQRVADLHRHGWRRLPHVGWCCPDHANATDGTTR